MRRQFQQVTFAALLCVAFSTQLLANDCYDVFIVAGQSNMDGRGDKKELAGDFARLATVQPDVKIYYANPVNSPDPKNPNFNTGWKDLAPGFAVPPKYTNALPSDCFGPELSFGRKLADDQPDCRLALIKVTQGNTSLNKDWNPAANYLYTTLTNTVAIALKEIVGHGKRYQIRGMIWHQGESDVKGGAENYQKNLGTFIASVRRDLKVPELPFIIGEIATNKEPSFRAMQRKIAEETPHAAFVSAEGLETMEGTHFKAASVVELGNRFAAAAEKFSFSGKAEIRAGKPVAAGASRPSSPTLTVQNRKQL